MDAVRAVIDQRAVRRIDRGTNQRRVLRLSVIQQEPVELRVQGRREFLELARSDGLLRLHGEPRRVLADDGQEHRAGPLGQAVLPAIRDLFGRQEIDDSSQAKIVEGAHVLVGEAGELAGAEHLPPLDGAAVAGGVAAQARKLGSP